MVANSAWSGKLEANEIPMRRTGNSNLGADFEQFEPDGGHLGGGELSAL